MSITAANCPSPADASLCGFDTMPSSPSLKANSTASWAPALVPAAHGSRASRRRGRSPPSPSIRNDCALMRLAASTMAGKRSAQSWPLRVKQRTRAFGLHPRRWSSPAPFVERHHVAAGRLPRSIRGCADCTEMAACLNGLGHRTALDTLWNGRLVRIFARRNNLKNLLTF